MADIKAIGDQLVELTVKEVNELASYLKETHGIEPAAAVAVAGPAAGGLGHGHSIRPPAVAFPGQGRTNCADLPTLSPQRRTRLQEPYRRNGDTGRLLRCLSGHICQGVENSARMSR